MSKIYTANDLIRFIYQETNVADSANIQQLITEQPECAEAFEALSDVVSMLDEVSLNASPTSIAIIMEQAHKSAAECI